MAEEHRLRIIVEGKDKASGPLASVKGALGGLATVAGGILAANLLQKVGQGILDIGKYAIMSAADTEEMLSKFGVTFGEAGSTLERTLIDFGNDVGRSRFELQTMAADMGAVLKGMGLTDEMAANLSGSMTELAVDVGSFNNLQSPDVADRFQRALTGEFEALKALGIVINQNRIDQALYNQGITETWQELDQATRAQIVAGLLFESTSDAQGDAARTAGSFTNRMVALKAKIKDTATTIGLAFIPAGTELLTIFNDLWQEHGPAVTRFIEERLVPAIGAAVGIFRDLLSGKLDLATLVPPSLQDALREVALGASQMGEAFAEHMPLMIEKGKELVDWAAENLVPVLVTGLSTIGQFLRQAAGWWKEHGDTVIEVVSVAAQIVGATIGGLIELISGIVRAGLAILRGDWTGAFTEIKDAVARFMGLALSIAGQNLEEFKAIWSNNLDMARTIVRVGLERAVDLVRGLFGKFTDAGKHIIDGLRRGIESAVEGLISWLERKLKDIISLTRGIFRARSPSMVFQEIGQDLMAGLAKGIDVGLGDASSSLGRMGTAVTNIAGGVTGGSVVHISIEGAGDPREVAREVARELKLQGVAI